MYKFLLLTSLNWCRLVGSNHVPTLFRRLLWPHQLKRQIGGAPRIRTWTFPFIVEIEKIAVCILSRITVVITCYHYTKAPLIFFGSSYKVWTCDLYDVNVLLYHWAKELFGVLYEDRTHTTAFTARCAGHYTNNTIEINRIAFFTDLNR